MFNPTLFLACILGYFIGGIPFSFIMAKLLKGVDLRKFGSGNLGTTNTYRATGLFPAILVLLLDFLKCYLTMVALKHFLSFDASLIAGLFVSIGHCFSPYLQFKGGKAIATSAGYIVAINPMILLILLCLQFGVLFLTKKMSVASLTNSLAFPVLTFLSYGKGSIFYISILLSLFVIFMHRDNISRLLNKEEKDLF